MHVSGAVPKARRARLSRRRAETDRKLEARSDVVEVARVGLENLVDRSLGQRRQLLARLLHRAQETLGVRVVRADEEAIVAGELHDVRKHPLLGIRSEEHTSE